MLLSLLYLLALDNNGNDGENNEVVAVPAAETEEDYDEEEGIPSRSVAATPVVVNRNNMGKNTTYIMTQFFISFDAIPIFCFIIVEFLWLSIGAIVISFDLAKPRCVSS